MAVPLANPQLVAAAFEDACLAELQALKPGNVHVFADGHNMVVDDFINSARAAAPVLAQAGLTVGGRIAQAIEATWTAVGCNTNLGIVLLAAPLVQTALSGTPLHDVLASLTVEDADDAFRAILQASPAGLGESSRHDVREPARVTLLEAMCEAAERDRIAYQYATDFSDIFDFGLPRYHAAMAKWDNPAWAASAVHLGFMARIPDSHVLRKYGAQAAAELAARAQPYEQMLLASENPKTCFGELLRFDAMLKREGLNPGTSADLTVATLLAAGLEKFLDSAAK